MKYLRSENKPEDEVSREVYLRLTALALTKDNSIENVRKIVGGDDLTSTVCKAYFAYVNNEDYKGYIKKAVKELCEVNNESTA